MDSSISGQLALPRRSHCAQSSGFSQDAQEQADTPFSRPALYDRTISPPTSPKSRARDALSKMSTSSTQASHTGSSFNLMATAHSPQLSQLDLSFVRPGRPSRFNSSRSSSTISPILEDEVLECCSIERKAPTDADEERTNFDIKMTLTDLLNDELVRQDSKMRLRVQARLMEAELELKRQRRKRVSVPTVVLRPSEDDHDRRESV